MYIHVLSPYRRQFAYPSFWKLLDQLSAAHTVHNPIDAVRAGWLQRAYDTKLKHLLPLLFSLWAAIRARKAPDAIITFGSYQVPFVFLLRLIFPGAHLITYQPELFEFDSGLLTKAFRVSAHRYDLFLDVEPMRLKLRKRYFPRMRAMHAVVLPNFDHKVEAEQERAKSRRVVYAGVIDSEVSLVRMCAQFKIGTADLDCYVTKYLDQQPPQVFNSLQPRPFQQIAEQGYGYGLICYPFTNGARGSLNNKYCAPSKLFSYLAWGIVPVHYGHPTLKRFVKAGISTDRALDHDAPVAVQGAKVQALFQQMETQIAIATETIAATISQSATVVRAVTKI
ncbi:hypothetical protein EV683_12329 [Crenobacter luteus]|uniref:hypothetical protein n=1 Tax=Crenobacter luteus TaxID=1452487 RepID=UPI00104D640E|nr:hypothetical protein [Crenobacter luteus]TCP10545.1 hypothetical protein EV683_12329 [Crenobacter luteus]